MCGPYNNGWTYRENLLTKYLALNNDVTLITSNLENKKNSKLLEYVKNVTDFDSTSEFKVIRIPVGLRKILPKELAIRIRYYPDLLETIKVHNPDLVYVYGLQFYSLRVISKLKKSNSNIILFGEINTTYQNSASSMVSRVFLHRLFYRIIISNNLKFFDKVYYGSSAAANFSKKEYRIPFIREILPLGVDELEIRKWLIFDKSGLRKKYGIQFNTKVIITGGKIDKEKETIPLIEKFLSLDLKGIILLVFGEISNNIFAEFNELIKGKSNVKYIGWLNSDETYEVFRASDCAIFPGSKSSLWEVAAAFNIPVIVKKWPGMDHLSRISNYYFLDNLGNDIDYYLLKFNKGELLIDLSENEIENRMRLLSYKTIAESIINTYLTLK
jgi:1,2-diacylglycerol 3-alpha-glucosyltransferase